MKHTLAKWLQVGDIFGKEKATFKIERIGKVTKNTIEVYSTRLQPTYYEGNLYRRFKLNDTVTLLG